jgi:hypothetical protein
MSNLMGFSAARKTSRAELVLSWLDDGEVRIYDGTRPADADTAISTQTLLITLELDNPAGTVTNGVFTAAAIAQTLIAADGNAAWARVVDSTGATIFDADVGLESSGNLIEIDNVSLVAGAYCTVVSFTLTER